MDGGVAQTANAPTCNKRELAKLLDVSLPTLDKMIESNADFPIETQGSNGVEYEFDPAKVSAWRTAKLEDEKRAALARMESLGVLSFGDDRSRELLPTQQLALAKVEAERRKLARDAGFLVDVATLRSRLQPVVMDLTHFLEGLPDRVGRKNMLPPHVIEALRADLEDGRSEFVDGVEKALRLGKEVAGDLLSRVA